MPLSRRDLLKAGLSAATFIVVPEPLLARFGGRWEPAPPIEDPRVKELALRAIEAARTAGATYADVRLTHDRGRMFSTPRVAGGIFDQERMAVGARALVDGYWGFASGPVWDPDEMARLGREAVHQARVNAAGPERAVELAPAPPVRDGRWVMPVEIDPFEVSPFEIVDFIRSMYTFVGRTPGFGMYQMTYDATVQEKAFASSEGSYITQRVYRSRGDLVIDLSRDGALLDRRALDTLTVAGVGWELFQGQPIREQIRRLMEEMQEDQKLPLKPVDVGRYDVVCDALTVSRLLDRTLGEATQLDRALGYEANASGTSFLSDPAGMIGRYQVGASALTVTANRSDPSGAATVRWDDEGVAPEPFTLVRDGVVEDFQTTRESATWLVGGYTKAGRAVRSHGCAAAPSAISAPMTHTPNLAIAPGREATDFDGLVASLEDGLAVKGMKVDLDYQGLNGAGSGRVYEVKKGKRVARIGGAGFLFRAPELWKGLVALGGPDSVRRYGSIASKGEPPQATYHSVAVPPAVFKQMTVIDPKRKA
ncbi:MAG TPA: TldD/PmbA family protein [Longimicrobiales bacterium]